MSGRGVATIISTTDQPELSDAVQAQLERDRLFFLETRGKVSCIRPMVDGEALPYALPSSAMVVVKEHQREFVVFGQQTLIIAQPHETTKKSRSHQSLDVGLLQRERAEARKSNPHTTDIEMSDEEKDLRRQQEKIRRAAQVQANEDRRRGITAIKRAEKLRKLAKRRAGQASLPSLELIRTIVEIPAQDLKSHVERSEDLMKACDIDRFKPYQIPERAIRELQLEAEKHRHTPPKDAA